MTEPVAAAPTGAGDTTTLTDLAADSGPVSYNANYTPVSVDFGAVDLSSTRKQEAPVTPTENRRSSLVQEIVAAQKREQAPSVAINATADHQSSNAACQFGVTFPVAPAKDMLFLRVDYLPTRLFKFTGSKWVEVDKQTDSQQSLNEAYIEMLISKISKGEYEPDWLSEAERQQIEIVLQQDPNTKGNV